MATTIDFPSGAITGQQYTFGSRTWVYNGSGWAQLINQGQTASVFVSVVDVVDVQAVFPWTADNVWSLVNYV